MFTASNNTAAEYSNAATYAAGAFVIYDGTLYKCISAITTPEDWTPAHWQQTTIMENAGGGGGGGTTVIANPAGAATDTLNKLQVGATIYDVPSGGGSSGHTYSTTEHIVGTWIDGKTIYEKTVPTGAISAGTSNFQVTMNCANVDLVIHYEVMVYVSSGAGFALPLALLTSNNMQLYGATEQGYNKTTDKFRIDTGSQRAIDSGYITMQYTKTS